MDYVLARLGSETDAACLEQRAFYRLRCASMRLFQAERSAIKPDTRWKAVLPTRDTRHNWRLLGTMRDWGNSQFALLGIPGALGESVDGEAVASVVRRRENWEVCDSS